MSKKVIGYYDFIPVYQKRGGNDFCVISQTGGAIAKLQEPGWGQIQGGR